MADYSVTIKTFPAGGVQNRVLQVGHAFVTLSATSKPDITIGYYPIAQEVYGPGTVRDDSKTGKNLTTGALQEHAANWERTFVVSERQFNNMLNYASNIATNTADSYNGVTGLAPLLVAPLSPIIGSLSNVCTDFARNVLTAGEIASTPIISSIFNNMLPQSINLQYGLTSTNQYKPGSVVPGSLATQISLATDKLWNGIRASDPTYVNAANPNTGGSGLGFTEAYFGQNGSVRTYSNGVQYRADPDNGIFTWSVPNRSTGKWVTTSENKVTGLTTVTESPISNQANITSGYSSKSLGGNKSLVTVLGSGGRPTVETYSRETFNLSKEGASAGYSITSTTNNSTGAASYQLKDASGNPIASGSNYTVGQNNTIVFDISTVKQVYDLGTGHLITQIDANGAGFRLEPGNIEPIFYTAGQLAYNANSGVLTATVGAQSTQFFGTSNLVNVNTTSSFNTPTQTSAPDAASAGPSAAGNNLLSTGDYTVGIGNFWDVNTAAGNQAVAGYAVTDGLRPGNGGIGVNVNASSGIGLKIPSLRGQSQRDTYIDAYLGAFPDYSMLGITVNKAAQSNFFQIPVDPLVLDLNGDGVKLTNFTDAPVLFDADNDGGSMEQTGWVSSADGIVVHDLNADGKINNISETLSEYYNGVAGSNGVNGTKPFANGFAALKSLDSNNDNQFTSTDAAWSQLKVWTDSNHDGKTDAGELKTFAELGITAINLNSTSQSGEVRDGNAVLARGSFTQTVNSVATTKEAIAANFIANPAGSTITQGSNGITVATEGLAGSGATSSYVSTNTTASTNETLNASTLGVKNITGGLGADTLTGDNQNNWLAGSLGADKLYGGAGDDVLLIDSQDTVIDGGADLDIAQVVGGTLGQQGVTLNLSQSNIEIAVGGAANDVLSGGAGNDLIRGHRGQDTLLGGAGDDVLDGGLDDDGHKHYQKRSCLRTYLLVCRHKRPVKCVQKGSKTVLHLGKSSCKNKKVTNSAARYATGLSVSI